MAFFFLFFFSQFRLI